MESKRLALEDVYAYCEKWTLPRRKSFIRWEDGDITHEAFLCAVLLLEHYDHARSKFNTYLDNYLYNCVRQSYNRLNDVKVTREHLGNNRKGTRTYWTWTQRLTPAEDRVEQPPEPFGLDPDVCPEQYRELAYLLARGMRKQEIAWERGVTASAISHQLTYLRRWYTEYLADS